MAKGATRFQLYFMMIFILAGYGAYGQTDELGRLFTTVEERGRLDQMRYRQPVDTMPSPPVYVPDIVQQAQGREDITVNGIVFRKGGKSTVWIRDAKTSLDGPAVLRLPAVAREVDSGDVMIDIPDYRSSIRLQTGTKRYLPTAE